VLAEAALLADGVEHLAEQVFVGDVVRRPSGEPPPVVVLELLDLGAGDGLELR